MVEYKGAVVPGKGLVTHEVSLEGVEHTEESAGGIEGVAVGDPVGVTKYFVVDGLYYKTEAAAKAAAAEGATDAVVNIGETRAKLGERLRKENPLLPTTAKFITSQISSSETDTTPMLGHSAIAVGNAAAVVGEESIAIGSGARVGMLSRQVPVPGKLVTTHEVSLEGVEHTEESAGGIEGVAVGDPVGVTKYFVVDGLYYKTEAAAKAAAAEGATDAVVNVGETRAKLGERLRKENPLLESTAKFRTSQISSTETATTRTIPPVPAARAVALGADASVDSDNGTALGAGASVTGENGIAIGAGVTAGENEIRIGTAGQSAIIGGVDLAGIATNAANIATANTEGIATNVTGIATNAEGIATNVTGIATNAEGIATNVTGIATNAEGIATNVTGIATNAEGIATNVTGIATNAEGIATNVTGIATNAAGIATNTAGIATNSSDIDTNRSGVAMAIAMARLPTSLSPGSRGSWGISAGTFDGESAIAGGLSFRIKEKGLVSLGVSSSGGETGGGIGFSMEF